MPRCATGSLRQRRQGNIQFSSFPVLENRETHAIELHLTAYGQEPEAKDWATADACPYTLSLVELSSS
ncbi:MAG TPA: hypothetical protein EYP56_15365 [Planctomycetaceae bacterium]|nr:hypothetical protein [Planctomycetaceae bacterium]